MTEQNLKGRCLCGAVQIEFRPHSHRVGACHCSMCRRWSGGPLFAVEADDTVHIADSTHVRVYESSAWAERAFCERCGTHLYYRLKGTPRYELPLGLFGDDAPWEFEQEIFVDEQPAYYRFANKTRRLTGPEVFAMFAPPAKDE